ncbi:flagellar motor protein MotB [Azospirillum sp.]|uniref:flagellar motor protein MotB n=1 Tax=Azospirillum sp. TaxID=34012 RepID=UPI0026295BD4|nr:flagellar motor protein MotB [Azospirillum sp.]
MPAANADEDQEIWLLSYSDLVTLLLSVFVMLLAMTTLKDQCRPSRCPRTPRRSAWPLRCPANARRCSTTRRLCRP